MRNLNVLTILVAFALASCGPINQDELAFTISAPSFDLVSSSIPPSPNRVEGTLLLVLPTYEVISATPKEPDLFEVLTVQITKAVVNAKVFDSVTVVRSMYPEAEPIGQYDYKLAKARLGQPWYLSANGSEKREPVFGANVPIPNDLEQKVIWFIDSLKVFVGNLTKAATALGANLVAAASFPKTEFSSP
jgi:hypothetical protein